MMHFIVTEEHVKLIAELYWQECESEDGLPIPGIDFKYPFGSSDVVGRVIETLGWEPVESWEGEKVTTKEQGETAVKLLSELSTVLSIICQHPGTCPLGRWVNSVRSGRPIWTKASNNANVI